MINGGHNMSDITTEIENMEITNELQEENSKKYLTFLADGLIFGVKVDYVTEIITNHSITMLPMLPDYLKGIINLRGQIIPILDIRMRINKQENTTNETSCVIVLNIDSIYIGILVDMVSQVTDINEDKISPPPANNKQELINGILSLPDGTVLLLLDCNLLVNN